MRVRVDLDAEVDDVDLAQFVFYNCTPSAGVAFRFRKSVCLAVEQNPLVTPVGAGAEKLKSICRDVFAIKTDAMTGLDKDRSRVHGLNNAFRRAAEDRNSIQINPLLNWIADSADAEVDVASVGREDGARRTLRKAGSFRISLSVLVVI